MLSKTSRHHGSCVLLTPCPGLLPPDPSDSSDPRWYGQMSWLGMGWLWPWAKVAAVARSDAARDTYRTRDRTAALFDREIGFAALLLARLGCFVPD